MRSVLLFVVVAVFAMASARIQQTIPKIWDLTDGEDKGVGAGFDVVDDFRQTPWIFKYTYDQQKTISVNNKKYLIPDYLAGQSIHRAMAYNETQLSNSWSDYYKYSFKTTSISVAATFANVTLNAAFTATKGAINQLTQNGTRSFAFNGATFLTFGLQFRGLRRPEFDDDFAYDLAHLPTDYNSDAYRRFIKAWGTHYFTNARYGCEYNVTVSVDKKFLEQRNVNWATQQFDLTIKYNEFQLGIKTDKLVNKSNIDGNFLDGAKVIAGAKGGDEMKFIVGHDFDAWLGTCDTLKVPIVKYSEVEALTEIIDDLTIKANLQRAIIEYGQGMKKRK